MLVVSATGQKKIANINDITKPDVSFTIAGRSAPAGVYAEQALKNMGLWDKISQTLKARPSTVNSVAMLVKTDQVDGGLVYSSVANGNGLKSVQAIEEKHSGEIVYGVGVIKGGKEKLAKDFLDYSVKKITVFEKYGWIAYAE